MFITPVRALLAAASLLAASLPGHAQDLPAPTGDVILTISGNIKNTNVGDTAQFDHAMLAELGTVSISTSTPWYDQIVTFEGTPLEAVMKRVGAEGESIRATALNDYETMIPLADAYDTPVILATKLNGEEMSVRDKGPIFVIYPYDSEDRFQSQTYYARSAWQVTRLVIQ